MLRYSLMISLLLSTVPLLRAQDEGSWYLCKKTLPVIAPTDAPLEFQQVTFDSTFAGSGGGVALVNKSDKAIRYYVIILEFLDADGKYLVSAPVYNVDDSNQSIPFELPFKPWLKRNWLSWTHMAPVPAKSDSSMYFQIALAMVTCPASARVSMIELRYDDNTDFKYISPTLNIPTTPAQAMEIKDVDGAVKWSPLAVTGMLQIDTHGHAKILELDAGDVFRKWLQMEFNHWRFVPAWVEGKAATTQLPFVFLLGGTTQALVQVDVMRRKGIRGPMLVFPHFE
jgi:hypothetical protein